MPSRSSSPSSRPLPVYQFLCLLCAFAVAIASAEPVFGQSQGEPAKVIESTAKRIQPQKQTDDTLSFVSHAEARKIAAQRDWPVRFELAKGGLMELHTVTNGHPRYYKVHNLTAAKTVSTDECWPGGLGGYGLTGSGITLGVWDGGAVRTSHVEFDYQRAVQQDGATTLSDHATHVAGTMISAGTNANAKGMAYAAHLSCYDWSDDLYEMEQEAAAGLRISNHSYGESVGWDYAADCDGSGDSWWWMGDTTVSDIEDYVFGFYTPFVAQWDALTFNYPYYLTCCSAGNDRDEGPGSTVRHCYFTPDGSTDTATGVFRRHDGWDNGGFDTVSGAAVAKNSLTVGAIEDLSDGYSGAAYVQMTPFSCWGPTDDGRIKPDIVGNGRSLTSPLAGSDTEYASFLNSFSGTSMAAANVSGSLGLLAEHWHITHPTEADMLSSTLKGLVLHTADECGANDGPDYTFGWGLLNTRKAADVITQDTIQPTTISEHYVSINTPFVITLTTSGAAELRATICWTDPAGTPPEPELDPTIPMLVNDLDMTITSNISQIYYPWILDPANPAAPATTGDNNLDNVEQIVIKNPGFGTWHLKVAAGGALTGAYQRFSLIVTGASSITVDCNSNGTPDDLDILNGISDDCNRNQVPDECELAMFGGSGDCNNDGIMDVCQLSDNDCNNNGILDECDIADATSEDCNDNGTPDDCEVSAPLSQTPNFMNGILSDMDCNICSGGTQQAAAENFTLSAPARISSIVVWGGYAPFNTPLDTDLFTVRFHTANNDQIGDLVDSQTEVSSMRSETEESLGDFDIYQYTLLLNPPVSLSSGTYFVEIFNDSTGSIDTWFWTTGGLDETASIEGSYFDDTAPAVNDGAGGYNVQTDLAIRLVGAGTGQDCNADGLLDDCVPPLTLDLGPDRTMGLNRTHTDLASMMQVVGGSGAMTYHWEIISGPSLTGLSKPDTDEPAFRPQTEGIYVIRCSVTDSSVGPCTATDNMVVIVAQLDADLPSTLYGCVETQTRPLGNIPLGIGGTPPYTYEWVVLEGPTDLSELGKTLANPTLTPPNEDSYILQVTITDSSEPAYSVTKTAQLLVAEPPTVDAGEVSQYHPIIMIGEELDLGGAPTAAGGSAPYEFGWSIPLNPDGAASISDASAANPKFSATAKGGYLVRVQITDQGGCSAETQFTVTVVADPPSSLVPVIPGSDTPAGLACGMCGPANAATLAFLCIGYLALYAQRRSRRR